jgi:hypothetical protein
MLQVYIYITLQFTLGYLTMVVFEYRKHRCEGFHVSKENKNGDYKIKLLISICTQYNEFTIYLNTPSLAASYELFPSVWRPALVTAYSEIYITLKRLLKT